MTTRALVWLGLMLSSAAFAADSPQQQARTYDPDPQHLWNRLHEALFIRVGPSGELHGQDRIDPLFWPSTKHLLIGDSHRQALGVLDEFLRERGEKLIRDPLRRAFLQHDLWALFDWSTQLSHGAPPVQARELQRRFATIMRRLALTQSELASLPDNYPHTQARGALPTLPHDLLQADGEWVNVRPGSGGPVAPTHLSWSRGRSLFRVLLRLPDGRSAALSYLEQLRSLERPWVLARQPHDDRLLPMTNPALPQFPAGTQWALVRLMCVIDADGRIQATPIVESIQLRRYLEVAPRPAAERDNAQEFLQFVARRRSGGELREVSAGELDFWQFQAHDVDPFELTQERLASLGPDGFKKTMRRDVLRSCRMCHGGAGIHSVQIQSRMLGPWSLRPPDLIESDSAHESLSTVYWKRGQYEYGLLQGLWEQVD